MAAKGEHGGRRGGEPSCPRHGRRPAVLDEDAGRPLADEVPERHAEIREHAGVCGVAVHNAPAADVRVIGEHERVRGRPEPEGLKLPGFHVDARVANEQRKPVAEKAVPERLLVESLGTLDVVGVGRRVDLGIAVERQEPVQVGAIRGGHVPVERGHARHLVEQDAVALLARVLLDARRIVDRAAHQRVDRDACRAGDDRAPERRPRRGPAMEQGEGGEREPRRAYDVDAVVPHEHGEQAGGGKADDPAHGRVSGTGDAERGQGRRKVGGEHGHPDDADGEQRVLPQRDRVGRKVGRDAEQGHERRGQARAGAASQAEPGRDPGDEVAERDGENRHLDHRRGCQAV